MLRFYWPYSAQTLMIFSILATRPGYGWMAPYAFIVAGLIEIVTALIFFIYILRSQSINTFSPMGLLASQFDLDDEFDATQIFAECGFRALACIFGFFGVYILTFALYMYSTFRLYLPEKKV
jgi:hypothetical protein